MEVSGAVTRRLSSLFRCEIAQSVDVASADARRAPCSLSVSGGSVSTGTRVIGLVGRRNIDSSRFSDNGHLRYYVGPNCQGRRLKKEKEAVKKKLKLLKGLSGYSSTDHESGLVFRFDDCLIGDFQADRFSIEETREALVKQLQQLKSEEKDQKRRRKLEKAKLKATRAKTIHESSSSSSSESSDNEGYMTNTSYQIRKALSQPFPDQWKTNGIKESTLPPPLQSQLLNSDTKNIGVARSVSVGRVEVCMGNKCKKAGAAALMEEFERVMGADGAVCGCKCMGKCRDGPNVRVSGALAGQSCSANPLCIGVGVEDVGRIVADHLGQQGELKQSR
ncbi:Diacylglycerol O-acyltransferase 3, cytosolic [Cucurbita argyrosperma subsp. argyrosperma]